MSYYRKGVAPVVSFSGRPAHDEAIKQAFGLDPKAKWPDQGMPSKFLRSAMYTGTTVQAFVISKEAAKREGRFQRALCLCPKCSKVMPLGRLNQHWLVQLSPDRRIDGYNVEFLGAKPAKAGEDY